MNRTPNGIGKLDTFVFDRLAVSSRHRCRHVVRAQRLQDVRFIHQNDHSFEQRDTRSDERVAEQNFHRKNFETWLV